MFETQEKWDEFTQSEISILTPILAQQGVELESDQPHISGERFLMSGRKVVLIARDKNTNKRLIIKSSTEEKYITEIEDERKARQTLEDLPFAYHPLLAPQEIWYQKENGRVILATEYIEQIKPYLSLPLIEQFDLILNAFTMLSGVHATTTSHNNLIKDVFGIWDESDYLNKARFFVSEIQKNNDDPGLANLLNKALEELAVKSKDMERYCGFLTHDDFALHNFRFRDNSIYLIDQSSLMFGNKHESWARLMNYMILHNQELEQALIKYLRDNAAPEEMRSLRLMRIYKVVELLNYHTQAASRVSGDIEKLCQRRVLFWHQVLKSLLNNETIKESDIENFKRDRDKLRSTEEIERQKALQQLV